MLVLTRKVGDKIWIGDDICLTVVQVERGKVRLGIDAPRSVVIRRAELPAVTENSESEKVPVLVSCP
jgi:carbon storage regulator